MNTGRVGNCRKKENMKIPLLTLLFIAACTANLFSQTYVQPNTGLKSHETLVIRKIELTPEKTVVYLAIENRIKGGNFCADKNIYIIYPDGTRSKLTSSKGIPVCPESYTFKSPGEKLQFTLEFPPLKPGTEWIDIVEMCNDNCFSFYGVTMDSELNARIDAAFSMADKGEKAKAIGLYKNILGSLPDPAPGIKGAIYSDIITLLSETGDRTGAKEWYNKLVVSKVPKVDLYVKNLNSRGIKF
jgi:hypothetical protein